MLGWVLKCIVDWYWVGLVLRNVCKEANVGFLKECCQNFVKTPVLVLAIG